jgi:hypothetical protein
MKPTIPLDGTILTPAEAKLVREFRMYSPELQGAVLDLAWQMVNGEPGRETVERVIAATRRRRA